MNKIIQFVGALLGTLFGSRWACSSSTARRRHHRGAPNRPAFLMALWSPPRCCSATSPSRTSPSIPARWAVDQLAQAGAGEYALGVIALVVGLLMGLLVGVPLSAAGRTAGACSPGRWLILLAARDAVVHHVQATTSWQAMGRLSAGWPGASGRKEVVVDTSAIIDGRIADIARTGFIAAPRRAALRAGRAPAHRRLAGRLAPQPRAARPRHPRRLQRDSAARSR